MADLKAMYAAVDEEAALAALDAFSARWDKDCAILAGQLG
jgi:putative transposase